MSLYHASTTNYAYPPNPAKLGGKGAGLITMAQKGLPVPEALILTTEAWRHYRATGALNTQITERLSEFIEAHPNSMFSVRSGAPVSMPGMMDTILNVGVTDALEAQYEGAYTQFVTSWLGIVKGIDKPRITQLLSLVSDRVQFTGMDGDPLYNPARYKKLLTGVIQHSENVSVPDSRFEQVIACIEAVFQSWYTPRAKAYREMHGIPEDMGTACVIQRMVMGTAPGFSGSGVLFSRDPATGEDKVVGEFAEQCQGEAVVSGEVTAASIEDLKAGADQHWGLYAKLVTLAKKLEGELGDVQDIEFTVENGELYVLQTRTAKMSARARIETACALANTLHAGLPPKRLAYIKERVTRAMVSDTMVPKVITKAKPLAIGLVASPGAISGRVVFRDTPLKKVGKDCILVAEDTAPEDFPIMSKCGGIFTKTGGFTCHSAVVARGIGIPAVVGCNELKFTASKAMALLPGIPAVHEGDYLTIDGATGAVYPQSLEVKKSQPPRIIYQTLYDLASSGGWSGIPEDTYYYDCGLGARVVLPCDPADLPRFELQIGRMHRLKAAGKEVTLGFHLQGLGEDMFDPTPESLFQTIAEHYGPDLAGVHILFGVPASIAKAVEDTLGVTVNSTEDVKIIDLLDLLDWEG